MLWNISERYPCKMVTKKTAATFPIDWINLFLPSSVRPCWKPAGRTLVTTLPWRQRTISSAGCLCPCWHPVTHTVPCQQHSTLSTTHTVPCQQHTVPCQQHTRYPVNNTQYLVNNTHGTLSTHTVPCQQHTVPCQQHTRYPVNNTQYLVNNTHGTLSTTHSTLSTTHMVPCQQHTVPCQQHIQWNSYTLVIYSCFCQNSRSNIPMKIHIAW